MTVVELRAEAGAQAGRVCVDAEVGRPAQWYCGTGLKLGGRAMAQAVLPLADTSVVLQGVEPVHKPRPHRVRRTDGVAEGTHQHSNIQ